MNDASGAFNPYQPPAAPHELDISLAADVEFLASDKVVLCGSTLKLPRVCIETGERDGLIAESDLLEWTPRRWFILLIASLFLMPTVAGLAVSQLSFGKSVSVPQSSDVIVLMSIVLTTGLLLWLARRARRRVSAQWYICRRIRDKRRRKQRVSTAVATGCAIALLGILLTGNLIDEAFYVLALPFGLAFLVGLALRPKGGPYIAGTHHGLNVVGGLAPEFLEVVLRIIDESARETR